MALEEYLLGSIEQGKIILYLWQNENTVVIGSSQNPWKECSLPLMREDGVKLARRLSGGGAVYHDTGNLNFTFVAANDRYDTEKQLACILDAVNSFGLNAEFSGRNDLLCEGKKFSGNAYYFDENASYHHGTLLVDADLQKLSRYLTPSKLKIKSKGIDSVRSRVVNLHDVCGGITVNSMKNALVESFGKYYGADLEKTAFDENCTNLSFDLLVEKYSSWAQSFGESPSFDVVHERKFSWGEVSVGLVLRDAVIISIEVFSDSLDTEFAKKLGDALRGVRYTKRDVEEVVYQMKWHGGNDEIYRDILLLFTDI